MGKNRDSTRESDQSGTWTQRPSSNKGSVARVPRECANHVLPVASPGASPTPKVPQSPSTTPSSGDSDDSIYDAKITIDDFHLLKVIHF